METGNLLEFKITAIKQETPLAKTYELQLLNRPALQHKPGQFLTVIIETEKQEVRRSYSILSLPGETPKITVKKVDNGLLSRFILQHWKVGTIFKSLPPAGRFTAEPQHLIPRDIFFFAAGSGIVPILPQIKLLLDAEPQSTIHLIYSNHHEEDALFLQEIDTLTLNYSSFNLIHLFSDPIYRLANFGRLNNSLAEAIITRSLKYDKTQAIFLLCGPFAYMRMLIFTIGLMGFNKSNIRKENYLPEVMSAAYVLHAPFPGRDIIIEAYGQRWPIAVPSGTTILNAALKQGLSLPYSCNGGVCGNCAAICKSGKVFMGVNEVLTNNDLQQGWVLTCTGYPETDNTVIRFPTEQ